MGEGGGGREAEIGKEGDREEELTVVWTKEERVR